ncbi:MAG: PmoA family protein, partial [Candidatus Dormiibacterota bacterium]
MTVKLVHTIGSHVELRLDDALLHRYVYCPAADQRESPRPYFHPLRTLAGETVTIYRPHDHLWHHGLSMTMAQLSGENFWGGPTYVRDEGYVQQANNGRIAHLGWRELSAEHMVEDLRWVTQDERAVLDEVRDMRLLGPDRDGGWWGLDLSFRLTNVSGSPLVFGSPTTQGRPQAGYGGLFWRGPRSFLHGSILAGGGLQGPETMGRQATWIAFEGRHDGTAAGSTIAFVDSPGNPRHPTQWFVREDPYACVSASFMYDRELELGAGEVLSLRYAVVIAAGAWAAERIDEVARRVAPPGDRPPPA